MQAEIRKDYIQEKYVIIAPQRGKRPYDVERPESISLSSRKCVFCPKNIEKKLIIKKPTSKEKYRIFVLKNKYPALNLNNPKAYGLQEVIIETEDHQKELEDLSVSHIAYLLKIYAQRTEEILRNKKIEYILIFKNNGGKAGASLKHSHSQIFATSFLPPHLLDKSQKTQEYKLKFGTCSYCEIIKKERKSPRFVWEDKHIIAFTPWASMHNYEIWILPKRHLDNVTVLSQTERLSFAKILRKILRKIGKLHLPYNFYFHQVVYDENQHLYMKITPRGSIWAGVEIGSGIVINPISPEEAAKFYRKN